MQGKNHTLSKLFALVIVFLISTSLNSKEAPSEEKGKSGKETTKGAVIFDACGKNNTDKCEKDLKIPVPDYSKSLK